MKKVVALIAGMLLAGAANAGLIVDVVEQYEKLNTGDFYSYTHDINDDGFVLGTAIAGTLEVEVFDDVRCFLFLGCGPDLAPEIALFVVEAFDFDTGGITFGTDFVGDLEVNALGELNADGMLEVTVVSLLGDFYVGNSYLTVETSMVAEPATVSLLGLGLLAAGALRRRRAA